MFSGGGTPECLLDVPPECLVREYSGCLVNGPPVCLVGTILGCSVASTTDNLVGTLLDLQWAGPIILNIMLQSGHTHS